MLVLVVGSANATVRVEWQSTTGFTLPDGLTGVNAPGQSSYIQLVWTPDSSPAAVMPGASLTGGEVLIDSFWNSAEFADGWLQFSSGDYNPGNVFARIFEGVDAQDTELITAGTRYYWGPLVAAEPSPAANIFQFYDVNRNQLGGVFGGDPVGPAGDGVAWTNDGFNNTVIPEPSVLAMLAFGGLVLTIRRRFIAG